MWEKNRTWETTEGAATAIQGRHDNDTNSRHNLEDESIEIGAYFHVRSKNKIQRAVKAILWITFEQRCGHIVIYWERETREVGGVLHMLFLRCQWGIPVDAPRRHLGVRVWSAEKRSGWNHCAKCPHGLTLIWHLLFSIAFHQMEVFPY